MRLKRFRIPPLMARLRARWRTLCWVFAAWTVYALIEAAISHFLAAASSKPISWTDVIILECDYAYIAALLSPAAIWLADRFRIEPPVSLRNVMVHTVASIAFSVIVYGIWQLVSYATDMKELQPNWAAEIRSLAWSVFDGAPLYLIIVFVHNAGYYYKRYQISAAKAADLNAQLAQAQLQNLRAQINPHFLFNSLHSISELVHDDPMAAERMIIALSHLLRSSLADSTALEVPLERELELTQLYLDIEKMRFDDRLMVDINVGQETEGALVPNLILQPLVENAIKHGICRRPGVGRIAVEAAVDSGRLVITIRDNGAGLDAEHRPVVEGVGLRTTRGRLEQLYGAKQSFHFVRRQGNTEAVIRMPFKVAVVAGRMS